MGTNDRALKIAILGWGSLIWDERPEFDDWHGDWLFDGPTLALEFSRISESRRCALTLVIDDVNGADCKVAYTISKRRNPDDAICDLRCREGTSLNNIAFHFADGSRSFASAVPEKLKVWTKEKQIDVAIWTALRSNFQQKARPPRAFSVSEALSHIQSLSPEGKVKAAEYVWRAPPFIQTPLRSALETQPWFFRENKE